ncbi:nuclear transport factor 2 family protein [Pseudoxanthomonas sp.]|uniref:nuclear transport factor 2 family protein n=1 Tax=Pseudoxanthomonas sp. TaxID=1871049 RepID=UPI002E1641B5|nr:nuclear transport factor 2 family protein [Pseudoxanthomonas sp.]
MAKTGITFRGGLLACLSLLAACASDTPEARLRQQFDTMQAAVEAGSPSDFIEGVSTDFVGEDGLDRAALHNLLRARALTNTRIGATTGPLDVSVDGDNAEVAFDLLLTAGQGGVLPDQAGTYRVVTAWRLEADDWRVHHARWERGR